MTKAITVETLHKRYKDKVAVNGVSFTVEQGEIFGILGPNGAGKTTTIEILEGLRRRDSGRVEILGLDPHKQAHQLRERIGVQFQLTSIQEKMKVKEAIQLFSSFYQKKADIPHIIASLGLDQYLNKYFKDLSGGWKQRLTLALATIHDPDIIFLDEPSTGLDPQSRRELWELIMQFRDTGKTIVLTTHYMEEAERLCDRIAMFRHGEIVAMDTPRNLVTNFASANFLSFESDDADVDMIRKLPSVERVEKLGSTIKVFSPELQHASLHLFQSAECHNWTIGAFRFEVGNLDDLFVQMMGKEQPA